jgi:hypothetical protein
MTRTPAAWPKDDSSNAADFFDFQIFNRYKPISPRGQSMKLAIRTLVVVLALTGAAATTQTSSASTKNKVTSARTSMLPIPTCPPDDPNACGMAQGR